MSIFQSDRRLMSTMTNGTALIWDLDQLMPRQPRIRKPGPAPKELWDLLGEENASSANAAIRMLADDEMRSTVVYFEKQLRPVSTPDRLSFDRLIKDLESPTFAVREKASATLEKMGPGIVPLLKTSVSETESAEVRERIGKLLAGFRDSKPSNQVLRNLRAIAILELFATRDAVALLRKISDGFAAAPETRAAKAACNRLRYASRLQK